MFNYLYKKYTAEILKKNICVAIKELKPYEKVLLVIAVLLGLLSAFFSSNNNNIAFYISIAIVVIDILLIWLLGSTKEEQKRIVKEIMGPSANERMQKMIQLLVEFGIDISNEEQLNNLIEQAKKTQAAYDVWKYFRILFSGTAKYILLPTITIFISEFFKDVGWETLVMRAWNILVICLCVVLIVSAFGTGFNDILNPDKRNLNRFIHDVEDIKIFKAKAKKILNKEIKKKRVDGVIVYGNDLGTINFEGCENIEKHIK